MDDAAAVHEHDALPSLSTGDDDGQLACAGVGDEYESSDIARDPSAVTAASGDQDDDTDGNLYPLLGMGAPLDDESAEEDATQAVVVGYHQENADDIWSGDHGGRLLSDPALYDDDDDIVAGRLAVEATPVRFSDGGFGGVPASAAAIAGLKKQRYDGSSSGSGADDMCVICMRAFKKGKRLFVMRCPYKHRFHRKCLKKWLSSSHLCSLCRHALPTEEEQGVPEPQYVYFNVN